MREQQNSRGWYLVKTQISKQRDLRRSQALQMYLRNIGYTRLLCSLVRESAAQRLPFAGEYPRHLPRFYPAWWANMLAAQAGLMPE